MNATRINDAIYPASFSQNENGGYNTTSPDVFTSGELRVRSVADKRQDHAAQLSVRIATIYPKRTTYAGMTFCLDRESVQALIAELQRALGD